MPPDLVQREDIQGNILRSFKSAAAAYVFLEVEDATRAKDWLGHLIQDVTTAAHKPGEVTVNVGLTHDGLATLGVPQASLDSFPDAFTEGMAKRSTRLKDTGANAPAAWEAPFRECDALHVVVIVTAGPSRNVNDLVEQWRSRLVGSGLTELANPLITNRLPEDYEHFGYRDGVSQPGVIGMHDEGAEGEGIKRDGEWQRLQPGEFILGLPDEDGLPARLPKPPELGRNGSYLVLRKLKQDVPLFRRLISERAERLDLAPELVKAKLMGRWPDGTPLTLSPKGPDASISGDPQANNRFTFDKDLDGTCCPVGSHIRRANPRGSLGFDGALERRHRIIRRGMPYGEALAEGAEDDADRGLLFACYQADIERQFEFIQGHWLNDGNVFGLGADRDPLVGDPGGGTARMCIEGRPPLYLDALQQTVIVRGGVYLLVPGIAALQYMSRLPDPQPSGSTTTR